MTASSRGIFRVRSSSTSVTDNQRANINLTRTASTTNSDGGGCPQDVPSMPPPEQEQQPSVKTSVVSSTKIERTKSKKSKTPLGKKIKKLLASTRKSSGSNKKTTQTSSSSAAQVTLRTSYDGVDEYRISSSEQDPSPFQVELPTKKEITVHSRICRLMDGYSAIHRNFDFSALSGLSRSSLQQEYEKSTEERPLIAGACHRDIAQKLLACGDDVVVEAFVREYEYTDEEKDEQSEPMEACILSSDSLRQIIVCFGARALDKSVLSGKEPPCILHEEQNVPILAAFRAAYFGTPMEKKVFALLANIAERKPFFDVVMVGHSFGAATATVAALRYAVANCQMRVSCHVFGSPRVGGEAWRQAVHAVPNLRVHRVENGADPYVSLPSGSEWVHCGHAIQIGGGAAAEFKARRFDRKLSAASNKSNFLTKLGKGKADHKIQSYDEKLTSSGDRWPTDFCEMKGNGIQADNEARTLA